MHDKMAMTIEEMTMRIKMLEEENEVLRRGQHIIPSAGTGTGEDASPIETFSRISKTLLAAQRENNSRWAGSKLEALSQLHIDYSGKAGELLFVEISRRGGMDVKYEGDKNIRKKGDTDGPSDVQINGKRDEIKCARALSSTTFQHECLKEEGSDQWIFIDSYGPHFYVSILPHFDLKSPHPILGKRATPCKGGYKFDLSEKQIQRLITCGHSIKVDNTTPYTDVIDFIRKFH